jgi:signal transduction histidine kinase
LINDVLDLSKIEAVIGEVTALVMPLAQKKGLALTARVSPDIGDVVSDRRRLEQILINLLNNAIKFTDAGFVQIIAEKRDGVVSVRVVDSGIGIKQEDLQSLFQPFRQIDTGLTREYEGTGLGLAICRRLAKLLGGEISVVNERSKGSEFTLTIPVSRSQPSVTFVTKIRQRETGK